MKKLVSLVLAMLMLLALVPANAETATTPTKTFRIVCPAGGDSNPPVSEWWIWKAYEKMTGIHIEWEEVPESALNDRKNLIMASTDKPDAFWHVSWSSEELARYGATGEFVNIAPYLDTSASSLKTLLTDEVKDGLKSITMDDGGIYGMPWVMTDKPQTNARFYLNKNWLKNAGLEVPTSIDELSKVFEVFKTTDVNGNGDANDEWPIYFQPDGIGMLQEMLCGSYGIGNNGFKPIAEKYYLDANGKVQYLFTSEGMKKMWQQMADWYAKGYFYPETFGKYEYENWVTDGKVNDVVGMYGWGDAAFLYSDASQDYVGISALKGPDGDCVQSWCDYPVRGIGTFVVTNACADPEALIKWADFFYSPEGTTFAAYGQEGETYHLDDNGQIVYDDSILNYEGGAQLGAWQDGFFVYGGSFPWRSYDSKTMEHARKQDVEGFTGERFSDYVADSEKYSAALLPGMIPTAEEASLVAPFLTDSETYVTEARMKFVTGEWNFDTDWDAYVKQLEAMGSNDYITVKQAQYDRYLSK